MSHWQALSHSLLSLDMGPRLLCIHSPASVICQITFLVFGGFLGFPSFKKPRNLKTSKPVFRNHIKYLIYEIIILVIVIRYLGGKDELW